MIKFSKHFFILFILVTVLPTLLIIILSLYNTHKVADNNFFTLLEFQGIQMEENFYKFADDNLSFCKKVIHNTNKFDLKLDQYKDLLGPDQIYWIIKESKNNNHYALSNDEKILKIPFNMGNKNLDKSYTFFQVLTNKKNNKKLVANVLLVPLKHNKYKGLYLVYYAPLDKLLINHPPKIARIYEGDKKQPSSIIDKFFLDDKQPAPIVKTSANDFKERQQSAISKMKRNFGNKPPPSRCLDEKIKGNIFKLKGFDGKTSAIIETGIPEPKGLRVIFHHPFMRDAMYNFVSLFIVIPLLGLLLSGLAGYYLKKQFINPIEDLSNTSKSIASGNLSVRVKINTKQQEIKNTLENFNKMLDNIHEKEQLKESFITNLTHDLRTPLLAEQRTVEIMIEKLKNFSDPELEDVLVCLQKNNEHLLNMVNLLLEIYRFDEGKLRLKKTSVDLKELINQCFIQLESISNEKNIQLKTTITNDLPLINADYNCLKRTLINLIVNAIENIPKGSYVEVSAEIEANNIKLSIKDNGPGIPEEISKQLFDRYYAGQQTERKVGSGLGLYISKKFIEAHGGNITVDSVVNEYSNFIVSIPLDEKEKLVD